MIVPGLVAILSFLFLLLPTFGLAQSDACREYLMRHDDLRQFYVRGDGMALRVGSVSELIEGFASPKVYEVVRRKLQAHGLHDPDSPQWLEINLGYGLPGESTVWGVVGDGHHGGSAGRVLTQVAQHMDEFIALYGHAQRTCTM